MQDRDEVDASRAATTETSEAAIYGEGFAAVYGSSRYAVFSRFLARIALSLLEQYGAPGRSLLDLACGAGAGSMLLAEAGYHVTALDKSAVMVRCTEERALASGVVIETQCQDMRTFTSPHPFDVATCLFDSLNYILDEDELVGVMSRVAGALVPGGLFVFDMNTPHGLATRWGTRDVVSTARNDLFEINRNRYDPKAELNNTTTIVFVRDAPSGLYRRYTEVHRQRGYTAKTATYLVERAGLAVVSVGALEDMYHGLARGLQALSDDASRIVVVARNQVA